MREPIRGPARSLPRSGSSGHAARPLGWRRLTVTHERRLPDGMESIDLEPAISGEILAVRAGLRLAVAAYLARYKGQPACARTPAGAGFLDWCQERGLDPLTVTRPHVELYLRWMQEMRRFKPSIVSAGRANACLCRAEGAAWDLVTSRLGQHLPRRD